MRRRFQRQVKPCPDATSRPFHGGKGAFYAHFYTGLYAHVTQEPGCFAHDALAFIYLVQPDLFKLAQGTIRVATEGLVQGQT